MPDFVPYSTSSISDIVNIVSDTSTAVAAILVAITSWIGRSTIQSWRKQREEDRLLKNTDRIKNAVYGAVYAMKDIQKTFNEVYSLGLEDKNTWNLKVKDEKSRNRGFSLAGILIHEKIKSKEKYIDIILECMPIAKSIFGDEMKTALERISYEFSCIIRSGNIVSGIGDEVSIREKYKVQLIDLLGEGDDIGGVIGKNVKMVEDGLQNYSTTYKSKSGIKEYILKILR